VHEELINAPLAQALERLKGRDVFVRVLAPPHPAIGRGTLRVVRINPVAPGPPVALERSSSSGDADAEPIELTVTYDDYERLPQAAKPSEKA